MISDTPGSQMGLPRGEGLVVAYIPKTGKVPEEYEYRDGKRSFVAVAYDGVLMDILPTDKQAVKWWLVRNAARSLRLDQIEPLWSGPNEDFRVSCLPQLPKPEGRQLAMRQYSRGPWIILEENNDQQLELDFPANSDADPVRMA